MVLKWATNFLLFSVIFSSQIVEARNFQKYWQDVQFNFEDTLDKYNEINCYENSTHFVGCLQGVNYLLKKLNLQLQIKSPSQTLLPHASGFLAPYLAKDLIIVPVGRNPWDDLDEEIKSYLQESPESVFDYTPELAQNLARLNKEKKSIYRQWQNRQTMAWINYYHQLSFQDKRTKIQDLTLVLVNILRGQNLINETNQHSEALRFYNLYLSYVEGIHSMVLPKKLLEELLSFTQAEEQGLGIILRPTRQKEGFLVDDLIPGGAAEKAGLHYRDVIVAAQELDQKGTPLIDLNGASMDKAPSLMEGEEGTRLALYIKRQGKILPLPIVLTREAHIIRNTEESYVTNGDFHWGVIKLRSFTQNSCHEIHRAILKMLEKSVQGLVLDLRKNTGGFLDRAICIGHLLVGENRPIVGVQYFYSINSLGYVGPPIPQEQQQITWPQAWTYEIPRLPPLVILLDSTSASASELVAAAVQDYAGPDLKAMVVGERSFGKGTVQHLVHSPNLAYFKKGIGDLYFKLTTAQFFRPSGTSTEMVGVTPDVEALASPQLLPETLLNERQEDRVSGLQLVSRQWVPHKIQEMWSRPIKNCAAQRLKQTQELFFQELEQPVRRPDFQLWRAFDVLACLVE